jgi:hypothetical protein
MAILGVKDVTTLLDATPPLDHGDALAAAAAWLAGRPASETASRAVLQPA